MIESLAGGVFVSTTRWRIVYRVGIRTQNPGDIWMGAAGLMSDSPIPSVLRAGVGDPGLALPLRDQVLQVALANWVLPASARSAPVMRVTKVRVL